MTWKLNIPTLYWKHKHACIQLGCAWTACNNRRSLSWHCIHVVPAQLVCICALSVTCMFSYISCYATVLVCTQSHKQVPGCTVACCYCLPAAVNLYIIFCRDHQKFTFICCHLHQGISTLVLSLYSSI